MLTQHDIQEYLRLAMELAREGGKLALELAGKTASSFKADKSIVTEADRRVQDLIVGRLARQVPDHGLIAEESTELTDSRPTGKAEFVWAIDPIDGTRNYAAGTRLFSCSVGLLHQGRPIAGAIYEPNFDWLFAAAAGGPATFNGREAHVRTGRFCPDAVVGISINTHAARPGILHYLLDCCMVRNLGSTALHLGMAGAGLIDGAIHFGGKLWDIAAGALIVERAGGMVYPVDADGKIIKQSLWPMDLGSYQNTPIPFIAGGEALIADLKGHE